MQTILVCDDDKEIVEAIEIYLQQEGYHILKAYDGEEALEILKENEVHLLIMDVMMPRLDGIRATLKIREESSIPIIILSAKTEEADKILALTDPKLKSSESWSKKTDEIRELRKQYNFLQKFEKTMVYANGKTFIAEEYSASTEFVI